MRKIKRRVSRKKDLPRVSLARRVFALVRKIFFIPAVLYSVLFIASASWFYFGGYYDITKEKISDALYTVSSKTNLVLKNVYLEGQKYSNEDDIIQAINVNEEQAILGINIWKIQKNLESLPWVKYAVVERQYPSTLSIRITERTPKALWQNLGKVHLIDSDGKIINDEDLHKFSDLIILVGNDVPTYAGSLLGLLSSTPEISKLVSSAIRVGERRWNIRLYSGIEIKLPEDNFSDAWSNLSKLHKENKILDSTVKVIDLRLPGKMFTKS